jgi:hypothetical protein
MHIYIDTCTSVIASPEDHLAFEEYSEGEEFTLLAVDVLGANTYRVTDGKPVLVKIALPVGLSDPA